MVHIGKLLYGAWRRHHACDAAMLAGAVTYFGLLATAPVCVLIVSVAGLLAGRELAQNALHDLLQGVLAGPAAASLLGYLTAAQRPWVSGSAALVSLALLVYATLRFFVHLRTALKHVWEAGGSRPVQPSSRWRRVLRNQGRALVLVVLCAAILLLHLLAQTVLATAASWLPSGFLAPALLSLVELGVTLVLVGLLVAELYRFLPPRKVAWRDAATGALGVVLLLLVGTELLQLYFHYFGGLSLYGALGSLALVMVWLYFCAHGFLFGASLVCVTEEARRLSSARTKARCLVETR